MTNEEYKKLTRQEFDSAAAKFDDDDPSVYNLCRNDYPDILSELEREEFSDVLDCGCGTGAMINMFKQKHPEKNYTGIDLSEKMIKVAKSRKLKGVMFVQGDCEELPFSDQTFDVITCSMSFHHYPNPERFFQNCHRILKPGGRLILRDMTGSAFLVWLMNHIELPIANKWMHKGDVHAYSLEEIRLLCDRAKLKPIVLEQRKGMRLHAVCKRER